MPLLLGLFLVAVFIWFAENIGTLSKTWLYPSQIMGWSAVPVAKLGSWFLLLLISYALVAIVNRPREIGEHTTACDRRQSPNKPCAVCKSESASQPS
jgi:uncharacterized membrane protein YoaT (DUF817 family)